VKVLFLRADDGGCAKYRGFEPARVVREQFPDVDVRVATDLQVSGERSTSASGTQIHEVHDDVDVIVVQRPLNEYWAPALAQARRQGIATVVELDDDLENVHPENRAWPHVQPLNNPRENYLWLKKSAAEADLLTCTTEALGRYNERFEVLPNYVPESIFDIERPERDRPVVGWTGTLQTHPRDLDVTGGQVGKVVSAAGADFFTVGDGRGVQEKLKLSPKTGFKSSGWVPLDDYYRTIAENVDVGIVPLERSDFNRAKSWLKGLEFAALGIPFIASATPDYEKLHELGVGRLAVDGSGFRYGLRAWLNNPEWARADGESYRDAVKDQLTYEKHAGDWVRAWERAIDIRKKASK
jgi:glycosyltransferase involved in cell wall biosynthesis